MEIHVTPEDILGGMPGNRFNCAIARAIRRQYGVKVDSSPYSVSVTSSGIQINNEIYQIPIQAREFIMNFDHKPKELVSPISFVISPYVHNTYPTLNATSLSTNYDPYILKYGNINTFTPNQITQNYYLKNLNNLA